jgi:hypothetical protein
MKIDPFAQFGKFWETWQQMADESVARTAAFYAEVDKLDSKNIERAEGAFQEMAKLAKETMAYNAQLGAEWRKISLENMKRATTAFGAST